MDPAPAFKWHDHHFINGIACLDFANTVVNRNLSDRREDRLGTLASLRTWFAAAGLANGRSHTLRDGIALREAIDGLFREIAAGKPLSSDTWSTFIRHYARFAARHSMEPTSQGLRFVAGAADPFFAIAHSALTLAVSPSSNRIKICGGCGWLFIDRTRNASKKWCIPAMCGSRDKARRYYVRKVARVSRPRKSGLV
jgi:predicted RNA-binding Zn ribbon-like protein